MTGRAPRVLAVEDDPGVRRLVELSLAREGYEVRVDEDGSLLDDAVERFRPDIAVLDVRLPSGPDGYALARRLRELTDIPVIFLSGAHDLEDRLAGFDAGASDYLIKPFHPEELLARVRALLALSGRTSSGVWQVGGMVIDEASRTVVAAGPPLNLTTTEFDLLVALAKKPGRVLSKTELLKLVWGYDAYDDHLVEVHMSKLRQKLESQGCHLIHTVRGAGYLLRA